jgi:hypothetical protein
MNFSHFTIFLNVCLHHSIIPPFHYSIYKAKTQNYYKQFLSKQATGIPRRLIMARQPTTDIGPLFPVTLNAEAHLENVSWKPVHGLHSSVTFLAIDLFSDVPFMIEKDKLRDIIDFDPRRRCPAVIVAVLFSDFRVLWNHVAMTEEALFHGRDSRKCRATYVGMAEWALDRLYARMYPVTEGNRLCRTETRCRINIKEIKEAQQENQAANRKDYWYQIFFQSSHLLQWLSARQGEYPKKRGHCQSKEAEESQGN